MKKIIYPILSIALLGSFFSIKRGVTDVNAEIIDDSWSLLQDAINGDTVTSTSFERNVINDNQISIKLLEDINATTGSLQLSVESDMEIKLDLNGHSLNAKVSGETNRRVFSVDGKLEISDSSDSTNDGSGTGKICGGRLISGVEKDGSGIAVNETGELILNSGSITDNKCFTSSLGGGGVAVFGGKFTMNGGAIYKNSARWGGGIGLDIESSFTMNGGQIYENESLKMDGSAINMFCDYLDGNPKDNEINLLGGKIYNNKSNNTTDSVDDDETEGSFCSAGSAVWVEGHLTLGGDIQIKDNYQGKYDESNGTWSELTNDGNLAIINLNSEDRGAGRYTVKVSTEKPLNNAEIHLSKVSEVKKVTPLKVGDSMADYGYTNQVFKNNNFKYFYGDVRNGNTLRLDETTVGEGDTATTAYTFIASEDFENKYKVEPTDDNKLPVGAIVGIVLGSVALVGGLGVGLYFFLKNKKQPKNA